MKATTALAGRGSLRLLAGVLLCAGSASAVQGAGSAPAVQGAAGDTARGLLRFEDGALTLGGSVIARHEAWQWMGGGGGDYSYSWARLQLQAQLSHGRMDWIVEPWYVGMHNLPTDAVAPPPQGPAGMGGLYYAHNGERNPQTLGLHQAKLQIRLSEDGVNKLTVGRYAYASGLAHQRAQDGVKFNTLKTLRLGDRLLSSFTWSAFGRSFDGVRIDLEPAAGHRLTTGYARPTEGGWDKDISTRIEALEIAYAEWSLGRGAGLKNTEPGLYAIAYRDQRQCSQRVDNCGQASAVADIEILTIGGHFVGLRPLGDGELDYLIWYAIQGGDWYEQNHSAWAFAAEIGYQWPHMAWKPWLRAGLSQGSGDDDPNDGRHETFHQLAPGTRKYQLFPYYDFQNSRSAYIHAILKPNSKTTLRIDASLNQLASTADRWYMGTGPTQAAGSIFGYLGRPSGGARDLSAEISLMLQYQVHKNLSIEVFAGRVWGGEVIRNNYPERADANLFTLQASTHF